ncbi:MAG: M20/M25/M40 family metallo-hydrolase [Acidobacteria bacterium]|nr:M20/M25/M40 family metallo-hydrolase [Acidobacteriota bacterium]
MNVFSLTRELVNIPSLSGQEQEIGEFLFGYLSEKGWECSKQPVEGTRFNLLACQGIPEILLSTHLDTVPPFFSAREDDAFLYGRGACDAKGIAAAMICAVEELPLGDRRGLGLLFVVGEETDSIGAQTAAQATPRVSYVIDGEPTDNQLVTGHKGVIYARISATGIAAHSAYPDKGDSAIDKLVEALRRLKTVAFPVSPFWGKTFVNVGLIRGGQAPNVVPDRAEAEILIRTVAHSSEYIPLLEPVVSGLASLEIIRRSEPQQMRAVDGFETKIVGYGTDIPALRTLGEPLLFGPGSIFDAHAAGEKISKHELHEAVCHYQNLIFRLRKSLQR